ncbi:MAG: alpha/beta fold hydrolase [Candidatus Hydrogenedentes bacterium]|nr:alpha/beta fold hydrolase [Candidatus Hydrogenedentota bacterium]
MKQRHALLLLLLLCLLPQPVHAQDGVKNFPGLSRRAITFWSDGTRLAGDLFYPKDAASPLPAIVLCHGWGGIKAHLNPEIAPRFAAAGYAVLSFDYRGWGESDSRLIITDPMPKPDASGNVTVTAKAVRNLVDPLDQQEDIEAAISFMEGEALVDKTRIGLWGSSFGGGHAVYRAAHDNRVKCIVAQVGPMDQRTALLPQQETLHQDHLKRVRGELPPVPEDAEKPGGLIGAPFYERFIGFVPADHTDRITIPVMIVDAELEHYFDNKDHGFKVFKQLEGRVPTEYHELKGVKHYDVYRGAGLDQAMALEIPWFDTHLKGKP